MKKITKRFIAAILSLGMLSINTFALEDMSVTEPSSTNFTSNGVSIEELVESGYTIEAAERLLELDHILKKMEVYGQTAEMGSNGNVYITSDKNGKNHLTLDESNLVIEMFQEALNDNATAQMTRTSAFAELEKKIAENPNQRIHTVKISDNNYLKATVTITDPDNENSLISTNDVAGPIVQDSYQFFNYGSRDVECTLEEFSGIYYAKCQVEGRVTSTSSVITLSKLDSAQASVGAISIQNAGLNVMQTEATEVGDYCQASNNVVFAITGSVGLTLNGVFNFSVNAGANWTQKAIIRAHKTSAYGIIWTLVDAYTI